MNDNKSLQTNDYYKNLNKHGNCSKCDIALTQDNYKKRRTVCKFCYNNNVLRYYKNEFCSSPSPKSDVSTRTDFSDISYKQNRSRKQTKSSKQSISNNIIGKDDPNQLCDKLRENSSKPNMGESDYTMSKMILDELLRTKCISRKEYNAICKNIGLL